MNVLTVAEWKSFVTFIFDVVTGSMFFLSAIFGWESFKAWSLVFVLYHFEVRSWLI